MKGFAFLVLLIYLVSIATGLWLINIGEFIEPKTGYPVSTTPAVLVLAGFTICFIEVFRNLRLRIVNPSTKPPMNNLILGLGFFIILLSLAYNRLF